MSTNVKTYVIDLLESWPKRERNIALLHYELDHVMQASQNEMIEAMALGHGDSRGFHDGRVSDKTLYIALNYQNKVDRMNADAKEDVVVQLVKLEQEQKRLEYYLSFLEDRQIEVLRLYYYEKLSKEKVAESMNLSVRTVHTLKSRALAALTEMYQLVMELH